MDRDSHENPNGMHAPTLPCCSSYTCHHASINLEVIKGACEVDMNHHLQMEEDGRTDEASQNPHRTGGKKVEKHAWLVFKWRDNRAYFHTRDEL